MNLPLIATLVLFVLTGGANDRDIGWGGWGRTIPVIISAVTFAGCAFLAGLPPIVIGTFPIAFLIWRTPGWHLLGGSINPAPGKAVFTFFRHLLTLAYLAPAFWAYGAGLRFAAVGACMVGFAGVATALAVWNYYGQGRPNAWVETIRGLALGGFLWIGFVLIPHTLGTAPAALGL